MTINSLSLTGELLPSTLFTVPFNAKKVSIKINFYHFNVWPVKPYFPETAWTGLMIMIPTTICNCSFTQSRFCNECVYFTNGPIHAVLWQASGENLLVRSAPKPEDLQDIWWVISYCFIWLSLVLISLLTGQMPFNGKISLPEGFDTDGSDQIGLLRVRNHAHDLSYW